MKNKEVLRAMKEERKKLFREIRYASWSNDGNAPRQFQQKDSGEWTLEESQNLLDETEERGRRLEDYWNKQQNTELLTKVDKLGNRVDKTNSKVNKRMDHLERSVDKNEDDISKLHAANKNLRSKLQKEKSKRKQLEDEVCLTKKVLVDIAFYAGISGPNDTPMDIHNRIRSIYNSESRKKIKRKMSFNIVDVPYREVEDDD